MAVAEILSALAVEQETERCELALASHRTDPLDLEKSDENTRSYIL